MNGLKHLFKQCIGFVILAAFVIGFPFEKTQAAEEVPDSPSPILISSSNSTRALTVSANTWRGNLPRRASEVFEPGDRVIFFVTNLDLTEDEGANAFRVYAEDVNQKQFRLVVEDIRPVLRYNWIYGVTVRIFDENGYNGQPEANGDVLIRLSWRGMTSNQVRLGLGFAGGKINEPSSAAPTPAPLQKPYDDQARMAQTGGDRKRFMEQATFGPRPEIDFRLRQIGIHRWIEEQFNKPFPTFPYPNFPLKSTNVDDVNGFGCPPVGDPNRNICIRDHYSQYPNQNWMFKEALYGDDQLRRRVSWALSQIWVVSGVDTQHQRWLQEYYEVLDRHAFGNYRNLMYEMTLNPAMGDYLDMVRSTRTSPNENYPREILQLFSIGLDMLNQDGTPVLDAQGNRIATYDQEKINQFTKVFTGWTLCNNGANPACPNFSIGTPNYIDPMYLAVPNNHDQTAKTLFNYPGAPNPTIPACTNCTNDTARIAYANNSINKTHDNIFYHPNVGPFVGKLLIQHLVTSDPSPAYVARVAAAFNNNGAGVRGDMKAVIRAILLDREARGSRKTDPNYGKLREPFQFATNILRYFDAMAVDRAQQSDGVINGLTSAMGQNIWYSPTVFNYYPPDYVVPGTDVLGPEFGLMNTGTSFSRINAVNTLVFNRINVSNPNTPLGTSISLAPMQALAAADPTGNQLIEALNDKMLHGMMSEAMKTKLRTAIQAVPAANTLQRAQQAVYLVATSSQFQVQR